MGWLWCRSTIFAFWVAVVYGAALVCPLLSMADQTPACVAQEISRILGRADDKVQLLIYGDPYLRSEALRRKVINSVLFPTTRLLDHAKQPVKKAVARVSGQAEPVPIQLTARQARAFDQAVPVSLYEDTERFHNPTILEVRRQERILKEGGFSDEQIRVLRDNGLVPRADGIQSLPTPAGLTRQHLQPREFDKTYLAELTKKWERPKLDADGQPVLRENGKPEMELYTKPMRYIVDGSGRKFLLELDQATPPPADSVWLIHPHEGTNEALVVRESGIIQLDLKSNRLHMNPDYGLDPSAKETQTFLDDLKTEFPEAKFQRTSDRLQESIELDCLQILANQQAGKGFVRDKILIGNMITLSVWGAKEAADDTGRFTTAEGWNLTAADMIAGNIKGVTSAMVGLMLARAATQSIKIDPKSWGMEWATGVGLNKVQRTVYWALLSGDGKGRAAELDHFNDIHTSAKLPLNRWVNQRLLSDIPVNFYDACRKHSGGRLFISPAMVRFVELSASTAVYYVVRSHYVDEKHTQGAGKK